MYHDIDKPSGKKKKIAPEEDFVGHNLLALLNLSNLLYTRHWSMDICPYYCLMTGR